MTNSATGAEASASMSMTRIMTAGGRSPGTASVNPSVIAISTGWRTRLFSVPLSARQTPASDCRPSSASVSASGIISRFSIIMPSASATAAGEPTTITTIG